MKTIHVSPCTSKHHDVMVMMMKTWKMMVVTNPDLVISNLVMCPLKSWILTSLQTKKLKCRKVRWFILDHRTSKCQNQCLTASSPIPEFILLFFLEDVTQEFAHILHVFHHSTFVPCLPQPSHSECCQSSF